MPFDWGSHLPILEADRVELRPLTASDAPALFAIFRDPDVMRYWSSTAYTTISEAENLIREIDAYFQSRALFQWGVSRRSDSAVIGTCTLYHLDHGNRHAEIGFALGRDHWGQGFMSEALTVLIGFAFERLDLHRLEADVDPRNGRSIRALERQGFRREGLLRERYHVGGEIQDTLFLGLLRREWTAVRA